MGLYNETLNQNIDNLQVNNRLGNGSGGYSKQTLYVNDTTSAQSIVLSDSYKNYDVLAFRLIRLADGANNYMDEKYYSSDFIDNCRVNGDRLQLLVHAAWNTFTISDDTRFTLIHNGDSLYVKEVIGIKY